MYQLTPLPQLYHQIDAAIRDNLQGSGFGQFRLAFQPNCRNARQIRLENTIHLGFELDGQDVQRLLSQRLGPAPTNPDFLPIWKLLHRRLEVILEGDGYGSLVVSFKRIKNNRSAVITIEGGMSQLVCMPVNPTWLA